MAKRIRAEIESERHEEEAQKVLDKALKKFDDEVKLQYLEEFKDTVGKKKLTAALASKEIDKIILYNNREKSKKEKDDDALSRLASNNL